MKNKLLNIIGIIAVVAAVVGAWFITKDEKLDNGINTESMDMSVRPGDDFYDYVTRGWQVANPIPDDYSRYGLFEKLIETNQERVHEIAKKDDGKIGTLYKIAMDTDRLNTEKTTPITQWLNRIDTVKSKKELPKILGELQQVFGFFWSDGVAPDEKNSEFYLYNINQGGVGLSRDYYFDDDEKSVQVRSEYKKYITKQMENFGINGDADALYAMEERMAKSFNTKELLRDPHANYHKMTISEFKNKFPGFDWDEYFDARGAKLKELNIGQPKALTRSLEIISDTDLSLIKTYIKFRIANSATGLLDQKTYDISFDFYNRVMSGQQEQKPRWKRVMGILDGALGEEIGRLYVKKYFPENAKKRMQEMVENLRRGLGMRIEQLDWMDNATKNRAIEKLARFKAKIGYPDKWRDYTKLEINNDSLFENMVRVSIFEDKFWMDKIGKRVDKTIWYMNAHEVNAYYDPSSNEICFPAGILQYPFFDMSADDAFNYGAIGSVIGHEMTHGFDDMGRQFDQDGNLRDWWTDKDSTEFNKRASVMEKYFNNIQVAPGLNANGKFSLGENLADYGGVTVAYTAFKNFGNRFATNDRFTTDQRFFIAYATVWTANIRPDEIIRRTKIDEHSIGRWRINGILPHIDAWYDAFDINPDDKLYIAPENRVKIW